MKAALIGGLGILSSRLVLDDPHSLIISLRFRIEHGHSLAIVVLIMPPLFVMKLLQ